MQRCYLDHNATSPMRPQVRDVMLAAFEVEGNPSSIHSEGRKARGLIEAARDQVAALVGGQARSVVFTSGASEANMLALTPDMRTDHQASPASHLFHSAIEHPSVMEGGRFAARSRTALPVLPNGMLDLECLEDRLARHDSATGRAMVAVAAVNSETGVVQPISEIGRISRTHGAYLHVDAVQAAGRIPLCMEALGCTSLSLSAHKIGGPKGVGALIMAAEGVEPAPLITGGPQENRIRAGTENVAGIAGFGEACRLALGAIDVEQGMRKQTLLRDRFETALMAIAPDAEIFGREAERVGNTSQFAIPGLKAETMLIQLDLGGVAVSSGSACSSGKVTASHVLKAMGVSEDLAGSAIRMSLGWNSEKGDVERLLKLIEKICMKNSKKAG